MFDADFIPPGYVGASGTYLVLVGILGLGWGLFVLWMVFEAFRLSRLQEHEHATLYVRAARILAPGPSRVVRGRVEVDGEDVAIEIDVVQNVVDHTNKNSRWHEWVESSRRSVARPFRLTREDGRSVLVEPDENLLVVDALTTTYPIDQPRFRTRSAVVRSGEEVYVYGDLHEGDAGGAYRGGAAFRLRPPRGGRMLVATEAMRDRYRGRIRYLRRCGLGIGALFVLLHGIFTRAFLVTAILGTHATATITSTRTYLTSGKHGPVPHYVITARADDGLMIEGEVQRDVYDRADYARATGADRTIPILRVAGSPGASCLGNEPSVHLLVIILGVAAAALSTILALTQYDRRFAWYDRKAVSEEGGSGHWVETRRSDGAGPPIDASRN